LPPWQNSLWQERGLAGKSRIRYAEKRGIRLLMGRAVWGTASASPCAATATAATSAAAAAPAPVVSCLMVFYLFPQYRRHGSPDYCYDYEISHSLYLFPKCVL